MTLPTLRSALWSAVLARVPSTPAVRSLSTSARALRILPPSMTNNASDRAKQLRACLSALDDTANAYESCQGMSNEDKSEVLERIKNAFDCILFRLAQNSGASWPEPAEKDLSTFSDLFGLDDKVKEGGKGTGLESGITISKDDSVLNGLRGFVEKRKAIEAEQSLTM